MAKLSTSTVFGDLLVDGTIYGNVTGNLTGNASTATSATSATSAGKWSTARTLTIGNTGKSVDGSANVSWTLTEIGAADVNQMGVNKVLFERFDRGTITGNGPITESDLIDKTLIDAVLIDDFGTYNVGDTYLGRLTTYLYFSAATAWTTTAVSDDGSTIYLNDVSIITLTSCETTDITLNFVKGWNKIVWTFHENAGGDYAYFGSSVKTVSNFVYMNAYPVSLPEKVHQAYKSDKATTADTLSTARTLTIGSTGKTFNGSTNISWTLAEIGAFPISGGTVTGDTIFNKYLSVNAWPGYGSGSVDMWYDGTYNDNFGALTLNKSIYTTGAVETNNLLIDAWTGYGTGYADLWYSATHKTFFMDYVSTLQVGNNKVYHEGYKPTPNDIGAAASGHTHNQINSRGNVTCETGANVRPAANGLSMAQVYNNGYPTAYGNVLSMKGAGDGQLLIGWSGTSGAHAPVYVRSRRDTADADWSGWAQVYTTANKPTAADLGLGNTVIAVNSDLTNVNINGFDSMMTTVNSNLNKL